MVEDTAPPAVADTGAPPPAAAQTPAYDGPEWLKAFPDDVRSDKSLHKYTSAESAARGLINAQRLIGMDKVPKPRGEFDPANSDWQAFLDAAGRPKSHEDYKFDEAKLPDGLDYDKGLEDKFRGVFHAAGLNGKQAQMLRDAFIAYQGDAFTQGQTEYKQSRDDAQAALQKELGQAYEPTLNAAKAALKEYADEKFVGWLEQSGLGNHPEIVRVFGKIGKEVLGETKLKAFNAQAAMSPMEMREQIEAFRSANSAALYDRGHPDNARLVAELTRMTERAYSE